MRFLASLAVSLILAAATPVFAEGELPFAHSGVAKDAERYQAYVLQNWKAGGKAAAELRLVAEKQLVQDPRAASRGFASAVAADPKNSDSWLGLAKALLAIKADEDKGSERYDLPVNASGAAYRAFELAAGKPQKAKALAVLGDAMQRRAYWRPAIEAMRASLSYVDAPDVRESFEKLRAEHGFRLTDYKTEAEIASPRVCLQFSESLSRTETDFAKYVSVDKKDPQSVTAEGSQLCVDGLVHGGRYTVEVRDALKSDVGEALNKPLNLAIYVPDRKPAVRFTGKSYVLPSRGQQGIPVVTINTNRVGVEVYRIGDRGLAAAIVNGDMDRQLYTYDAETLRDRTGTQVYKGEMDVATKLNEEVTTAFPLDDTIGGLKPGAYAMIARPGDKPDNDYGSLSTQWFIVSDLGLTAFSGKDGVHAFVRSLAETTAIGDANVKLVARNNEVLATAKSDANGYVRFEAGLARGEGGLQPALLVAEKGDGEYAFLDLTANAFDLSDRGVKGRDAPGALDGYLYTERGVYRPGEEVNLTALVRTAAGVAATLPVTLIVTRPDGVEHGRYPLADEGLGGRSLRLALDGGAMTGTWRAKLHSDPADDPINQVSFLVEDYVPERLDLTLEPDAGALQPGQAKPVKLTGRFLYGPPAAGLGVEGEIIVRQSSKDLVAFPGYKFGGAEEKMSPVRQPLENLGLTGDDGKNTLSVLLPAVEKTARPLEAEVIVRLKEVSGRTIERSTVLPVELAEPRIGIKPLYEGAGPKEGEKAQFEVVMLDAASKQAAAPGLLWDLVRLDTSWQWYSRDGSWAYEPQTIRRKVASGTVDALADKAASIAADIDYGRFQLIVRTAEAAGAESSVIFSSGWYTSEESSESPEILDVALDKASYKVGDTAKLRIASKSGGKALVAVLGNGLVTSREVVLAKGGGEIDLTVGSDWGPGAYATALLYRPMDEKAKRMPSRAVGIAWIGLDQTDRTLKIELPVAAKIKSSEGLKVPVKITGLAAGEEARVTVAAVDLGILNLTRFQAPAPAGHFYQQRKLALEIRDFYGRLIDGMRAERGKMRSGGDGMENEGLKGSPPVEETVAEFSGLIKVGADGTANVEFALPDFNGTVRVMAVAWSKDKLGSASSDVIVRDAVALTASGPRFLTLGDEARLEIAVHNVDGPTASYRVAIAEQPLDASAGQPVSLLDRPLPLKSGERNSERFALKPTDVGQHQYDVRVTGPDGIDVKRRLTFEVMPPAGDIKRTTVSTLSAGGKLTLGKDLLAGLIASRTRVNVSVGPAASFDVPGLLTALDRYPYGCAEQTVSRAMPLLYANAVAAQIGIAQDKALKERVQGAVDRVFDMQDSSGAFGIWGPGDADLWLTAYVSDFLTRAKETGYTVRAIPFTLALDRLQNFVANSNDSDGTKESKAYALYVLARNGRPPVGELRYFADEKLDSFPTALSRAQLGAALSMLGDKPRAERTFQSAISSLDQSDKASLARADYGSLLRDGAALVTLASETGLFKGEAPKLIDVVAKAYRARSYTSTQEQAWMLLAAHALGDDVKSLSLAIDGAPVNGSIIRSLSADEIEKGVVITNNGEAATDAVISVIGASFKPEAAISKGFKIWRSYYKLDGTPVELKSGSGGTADLAQNERLLAVVSIESTEAYGRVLLVDRLPAGLEIENPRLVASGDVASLDILKSPFQPEHTEFRDDRFVAAFNLAAKANGTEPAASESSAEGEAEPAEQGAATESNVPPAAKPSSTAAASAVVAYVVRAVTPGTFVHPAATVEDMYRPERYARTDSGTLTVSVKP